MGAVPKRECENALSVSANLRPIPVDFQTLFESAPGAYVVLSPDDPKFTIVAVSDAYTKATKTTRQDLLGRGLLESFPTGPEDPAADGERNVRASLQRVIANRTPDAMPIQKYDIRVPGKTSFEEHYWRLGSTPVLNEAGELLYIIHHAEDVTEVVRLKKAEVEHSRLAEVLRLDSKRAENLLRTSEKRFRQLAETSTFGLVIGDLEGRVTYLNPTLQRLLGYTQAEVEAGPLRWDQLTPPEFGALDQKAVQELERHGVCQPYEKTYLTKDGRQVPVFLGASMLEPMGNQTEVAGFVLDLTERNRVEEALRKTNAELEEFAYVVSHDLQEPLRMVGIYSQMLVRHYAGAADPQANGFSHYIQSGIKRMEMLIRDLLSYSRTVHEEPDVQPVDLNAALQEALEVLASRLRETEAIVNVDELPLVQGDEAQLAQIFQNMLSNALKYHKPGGKPQVHISAERRGAEWVISVRDQGIGFDAQYAERIFGLFKRLHRDAYPGTGLGLAICKRIVERYGGRIWAESEPEKGAAFFFTLRASNR